MSDDVLYLGLPAGRHLLAVESMRHGEPRDSRGFVEARFRAAREDGSLMDPREGPTKLRWVWFFGGRFEEYELTGCRSFFVALMVGLSLATDDPDEVMEFARGATERGEAVGLLVHAEVHAPRRSAAGRRCRRSGARGRCRRARTSSRSTC